MPVLTPKSAFFRGNQPRSPKKRRQSRFSNTNQNRSVTSKQLILHIHIVLAAYKRSGHLLKKARAKRVLKWTELLFPLWTPGLWTIEDSVSSDNGRFAITNALKSRFVTLEIFRTFHRFDYFFYLPFMFLFHFYKALPPNLSCNGPEKQQTIHVLNML